MCGLVATLVIVIVCSVRAPVPVPRGQGLVELVTVSTLDALTVTRPGVAPLGLVYVPGVEPSMWQSGVFVAVSRRMQVTWAEPATGQWRPVASCQ